LSTIHKPRKKRVALTLGMAAAAAAPAALFFVLNQGGQQQLNITPAIPTGTIYNVNITCTDPVQNQTGTIYNEPMTY
jgi:cobalamin biosynthesis protein CbiD